MEEPKIDFSRKIEDKINDGKVKMRSKWFFMVEKLGLESGVVLSIIFAIIFISLSLYIMREKGVFEFVEFGAPGWSVVMKNIPYELISLSLAFFIFSLFLIRQFDFSYRKPFYIISIGLLGIVSVLGSVSFFTGISKSVYNSSVAKMSNYYEDKLVAAPPSNNALIGRIIKCTNQFVIVETPARQFIQIKYTPENFNAKNFNMFEGQIIKILGQKQGDVFRAQFISEIKQTNYKVLAPLPSPVASVPCTQN